MACRALRERPWPKGIVYCCEVVPVLRLGQDARGLAGEAESGGLADAELMQVGVEHLVGLLLGAAELAGGHDRADVAGLGEHAVEREVPGAVVDVVVEEPVRRGAAVRARSTRVSGVARPPRGPRPWTSAC